MPIYLPVQQSFNPRPVFCPSCKGAVPEIRLMVGDSHKITCDHCGMVHLGMPDNQVCASCGCKKLTDHGVPGEEESFQCDRPCRTCQEKLAKIKAVVILGGIGYHCVTCGCFGGAVKGSPLEVSLREKFPDKKQFEIDQKDCPECISKEPPKE